MAFRTKDCLFTEALSHLSYKLRHLRQIIEMYDKEK
jgi:hypothetical protein